MKNLLFALLTACAFLTPKDVSAQEKQDIHNYYVLANTLEQLRDISFAAQDLSQSDNMSYGEFKVIIRGHAVRELSKNDELEEILLKAEEIGIQLNICGFSLKKFGITTESIPENMQIIENGIALGFNLQKEGYHGITL